MRRCYRTIILDGRWEAGTDRVYDRVVPVPGLAGDPRAMQEGKLWYRRRVALPSGAWTHATLILNGARFHPAVYVNGRLVSERPGGMTVTIHALSHEDLRPGGTIVLEIALRSLRDVDPDDASRIPEADHWRSNVSSCLWDTVRLQLHGPSRLARLVPLPDLAADRLELRYEVENLAPPAGIRLLRAEIRNLRGRLLAAGETTALERRGMLRLDLRGAVRLWRPEDPVRHRMRVTLSGPEGVLDARESTLGLKDFRVDGLGFRLNGSPFRLRAGTVVWHRWLRDPEAPGAWLSTGTGSRATSCGGSKNTAPMASAFIWAPRPSLSWTSAIGTGSWCRPSGSFFHGMSAAEESLVEQWRAWLDLCLGIRASASSTPGTRRTRPNCNPPTPPSIVWRPNTPRSSSPTAT